MVCKHISTGYSCADVDQERRKVSTGYSSADVNQERRKNTL